MPLLAEKIVNYIVEQLIGMIFEKIVSEPRISRELHRKSNLMKIKSSRTRTCLMNGPRRELRTGAMPKI
jgi:hypothetical protein